MAFSKLVFLFLVIGVLSATASAGLSAPTKHEYQSSSKESDVASPDASEELLLTIGTDSVYKANTDTDDNTLYTAGKGDYKPHQMRKNRKLTISTLKGMAG